MLESTCNINFNKEFQHIKSIYNLQHGILTRQQEQELIKKYFEGEAEQIKNEALQQLIEGNLRLIVSSAMRFYKFTQVPGAAYTLSDLVQEGIIGLMTALDKFDMEKGYKFSTYAKWWIDHSIQRALFNNNYMIRVPENVIKLKAKHDKGQAENITNEQLEKIQQASTISMISLDTPVDEEEKGRTVADHIAEYDAQETEDQFLTHVEKIETRILVQEAMESLTETEKTYIKMRFGLDGEIPSTLAEIGAVLGLSKEGVRQIEIRALKKIKEAIEDRYMSHVEEQEVEPYV